MNEVHHRYTGAKDTLTGTEVIWCLGKPITVYVLKKAGKFSAVYFKKLWRQTDRKEQDHI